MYNKYLLQSHCQYFNSLQARQRQPGKQAAKKMNMSIIRINEHQFVTVDHSAKTIEFLSYGVGPVVKIRNNKNYVLKINKNDISACNTEFLYEYLRKSPETAAALFARFTYKIYSATIKPVTRPAFYAMFNDNLNAFVEFFQGCSCSTKQEIIADHIVFDHDAKMHGVISLSTFIGDNRFCRARCKNCDNAICKYCYAASLTAQRAELKNKLRRIHAILTSVELTAADIPKLDSNLYPYFRFEAFGDINNVLQVKNYNLIAAVNNDINFTLWTKNPGIIQNAINNGMTLSKNIVIGLSSLYLNKPELDKAQKYPFIRFLFTVYDDKYIEKNNVVINCGAKHCVSCGICYKYLHKFKHGLQLINERKK